jgi:cobalt-zinc-cadmium resistance protein CzcA
MLRSKFTGEDLDKLAQYAKQIGVIQNIVGAQDIYVEQVSGLPQLVIKFHREKMAQFGLNIEDVNTGDSIWLCWRIWCLAEKSDLI